MSGAASDYEMWRESEAARLATGGHIDMEIVRELLILSCHTSPIVKQFFESRLGSEKLLVVLLGLAIDDYSGDFQMTASYWVSRFPSEMLMPHTTTLEAIAANERDSVAVHARESLDTIRSIASGN